ncbi:P-loop containing nucleoside triphosphate hydrolase protein [Mycena galopus ATCC 62051]|nr:P-loop containing nucleoside triphosphate hydrolase protein [Mycena galopus ATCC 62051]
MPRQRTIAETHLDHIITCLTLALPLLNELNDGFGPPFVSAIANTVQTLINSVQNVKQNKSECAQLMEDIHKVLCAIVNLHMKSETVGSLPSVMLNNIRKFMETLHKIYTFIEGQQGGSKIKHLFRNNEMKKLLKECHEGLAQATEFFGIQTQTQTLNDIRDFKKTVDVLHKDLIKLIEKFSDTSTVSARSSVYLDPNVSKNSSNSFSMLPSQPKIFHGREHELDHILQLIDQKSTRVAILGGGRMGKTSLARAVLHHPDISVRFEHKFFVSAEAATTSVELAALIGLHVGLKPGKDLTKAVVHYFSGKIPCLLILDNLETVWEPKQSQAGVEEFLSLLTGLEHLALIITMRGAQRPAKVQWSHPFLPPLQPLSIDAARQTFIEITDNFNTIEETDQLLGFTDNMPLAIDLIAHLADYEGFSNVLSRWKTEKTSLLSQGCRRQSSLDASLSLSLSSPQITSDSKELLSVLSILPNGLSEAELVQANLGIPNILSCKAALQATSLAYQDNNQRLVVLMPIREYIQQILPPSQSRIQPIRKHFYALLELFMKYGGEQLNPVVNQITLNLANFHEILQWGLHPHAPAPVDTIQSALTLNKFYRLTGRGHFLLIQNFQPLLSQILDPQFETMFFTELLTTQHYWASMSEEIIAEALNHLDTNNPVLSCPTNVRAVWGQEFVLDGLDTIGVVQMAHWQLLFRKGICNCSTKAI